MKPATRWTKSPDILLNFSLINAEILNKSNLQAEKTGKDRESKYYYNRRKRIRLRKDWKKEIQSFPRGIRKTDAPGETDIYRYGAG